jgi:hypothetical protein
MSCIILADPILYEEGSGISVRHTKRTSFLTGGFNALKSV